MTHAVRRMLGISVLSLASASALAADAAKATQPSAETRQQMASAHQKMAECLKSARPISECRDEMRASCKDMAAAGGAPCPMMDGMGPMKGHHHGMRTSAEN